MTANYFCRVVAHRIDSKSCVIHFNKKSVMPWETSKFNILHVELI